MTAEQVREFVRDVALLVLASIVAAVAPVVAQVGLVHITGGEWVGIGDHAGSAIVLGLAALLGTPITRRYGVGAEPAASPTSSGKLGTVTLDLHAVPATVQPDPGYTPGPPVVPAPSPATSPAYEPVATVESPQPAPAGTPMTGD